MASSKKSKDITRKPIRRSSRKKPKSLQEQFSRLSKKRRGQVLELARVGGGGLARETVEKINLTLDNKRRIVNFRYRAKQRKIKWLKAHPEVAQKHGLDLSTLQLAPDDQGWYAQSNWKELKEFLGLPEDTKLYNV